MSRIHKNRLEWSVFAVGLLLVLATLSYLASETLSARAGPPDIVVRLGQPRELRSGFLVPVEVANAGHESAEDVRIPLTLEMEGREPEEAELSFPFVPRDSRREGWVSFRGDPRAGRIVVGAIAFQIP